MDLFNPHIDMKVINSISLRTKFFMSKCLLFVSFIIFITALKVIEKKKQLVEFIFYERSEKKKSI